MIKKILVVQHVPFEGPGYIKEWASSKGIKMEYFSAFENDFPETDDGEAILLMGGPMSVNDDVEFINKEKIWLDKVLNKNIPVFGICLGAQFLADRLGAKVFKGSKKEIGWFPVKVDKSSLNDGHYGRLMNSGFADEEIVFHWHGEIFDIPEGCSRLFYNEISPCQGFYKDNVVGLQFHLETTPETAAILMENCHEDMEEKGSFIEDEEDILKNKENFKRINSLIEIIFDWWSKK